jgi:hypothetical protein
LGKLISWSTFGGLAFSFYSCAYKDLKFVEDDTLLPPVHKVIVINKDDKERSRVIVNWRGTQAAQVVRQGTQGSSDPDLRPWPVISPGTQRTSWEFGEGNLNPGAAFELELRHSRQDACECGLITVNSNAGTITSHEARFRRRSFRATFFIFGFLTVVIGFRVFRLWRLHKGVRSLCDRCTSADKPMRDKYRKQFRDTWGDDTLDHIRSLWPGLDENEYESKMWRVFANVWEEGKASLEPLQKLINKHVLEARRGTSGEE